MLPNGTKVVVEDNSGESKEATVLRTDASMYLIQLEDGRQVLVPRTTVKEKKGE